MKRVHSSWPVNWARRGSCTERRAALTLQTAWRGRSAPNGAQKARGRHCAGVPSWCRPGSVPRWRGAKRRRRAKLAQLSAALGLQSVYRGGATAPKRRSVIGRAPREHSSCDAWPRAWTGRRPGGLPTATTAKRRRCANRPTPICRTSAAWDSRAVLAALARAHAVSWPRLTLDLRGRESTSASAPALSTAGARAGAARALPR